MKICKRLNDIQFVTNRITPCFTKLWEQDGYVEKYFIKADENTTPEILKSFFDLRQKYIKMYMNNQVPEFCNNCYFYEPIDNSEGINSTEDYTFMGLYVSHRSICHCKCIYCCLAGENCDDESFIRMNNEKSYDIKPFFEYLDEKKLINENTTINLMGGELTEYPEESHYIIDVGIKNSCKFKILTNGIIYDEYLSNLMKSYNTDIVISLDSGSSKMYQRVKRVNAFDRVVENIHKYSKAGENNPDSRLMLKYIFCPGINDNISEIKKFKSLAIEMKAFCNILSIDRFWLSKNINKRVSWKLGRALNYFMSSKDSLSVNSVIDYGFVDKNWAERNIKNK